VHSKGSRRTAQAQAQGLGLGLGLRGLRLPIPGTPRWEWRETVFEAKCIYDLGPVAFNPLQRRHA
jgi:hypothetical protein